MQFRFVEFEIRIGSEYRTFTGLFHKFRDLFCNFIEIVILHDELYRKTTTTTILLYGLILHGKYSFFLQEAEMLGS